MEKEELQKWLIESNPKDVDEYVYKMTFHGLKNTLAAFYKFMYSLENLYGHKFTDLVQSEAWQQLLEKREVFKTQKYAMPNQEAID